MRYVLFVFCAAIASRAAGQATPDTAHKPPVKLDTLIGAGRVSDLVGIAQSANQGTVGAADLRAGGRCCARAKSSRTFRG